MPISLQTAPERPVHDGSKRVSDAGNDDKKNYWIARQLKSDHRRLRLARNHRRRDESNAKEAQKG